MEASTNSAAGPVRAFPSKPFAQRLERACDRRKVPPLHHGRQSWVRRELEDKQGDVVSPETVRKWFAGEAKPKEERVRHLATILDVDWVWLEMGKGSMEKQNPAREADATDITPSRGRFMLDRLRRELGGTVTIAPGVDLTAPMDEVWDAER